MISLEWTVKQGVLILILPFLLTINPILPKSPHGDAAEPAQLPLYPQRIFWVLDVSLG